MFNQVTSELGNERISNLQQIENLNKQIKEKDDRLEQLQRQSDTLKGDLAKREQELNELRSELSSELQKTENLNKQITQKDNILNQLQQQNDTLARKLAKGNKNYTNSEMNYLLNSVKLRT